MNKVFVGYDPREDIAYQVCKHSIARRNKEVLVRPLVQKELREAGWYTRPVDPLSSTEFTFTRFLIPSPTTPPHPFIFAVCIRDISFNPLPITRKGLELHIRCC